MGFHVPTEKIKYFVCVIFIFILTGFGVFIVRILGEIMNNVWMNKCVLKKY